MREIKGTGETDELDETLGQDEASVVSLFDTFANVFIKGPICNETINPVIDFLFAANFSSEFERIEGVNLFIDSPGGDLTSALKLIEMIEMSDVPIRTIGWGRVASAALIIFMSGHQRVLSRNASILSHQVTYVAPYVQMKINDPSQQEEFKNTHERIMNLYLEYTGKSEKYILKHLIKSYDAYLTASAAVQHGLADVILPRKKGKAWLEYFDFSHPLFDNASETV
jgi:ATP-dependent protease ClpP protease subunit